MINGTNLSFFVTFVWWKQGVKISYLWNYCTNYDSVKSSASMVLRRKENPKSISSCVLGSSASKLHFTKINSDLKYLHARFMWTQITCESFGMGLKSGVNVEHVFDQNHLKLERVYILYTRYICLTPRFHQSNGLFVCSTLKT